jgi:hypothetical protein
MSQLSYTEAELFADHSYMAPHQAAGHLLHGGFDFKGVYQSPRTLLRWPAVLAWQKQLEQRGWPLIDASTATGGSPVTQTSSTVRASHHHHDEAQLSGATLLDPLWEGFVHWHSVTTVEHSRAQTRAAIQSTLRNLPDAVTKQRAFDQLN